MRARLLSSDRKEVSSLKGYQKIGGLIGLQTARGMEPKDIIEQIQNSGLRGRGGAGFPTGKKWASVFKHECPTKYVCCNGAEGEPGTFKDRYLMRKNPYQVLEGIAIAAHVIQPKKSFIAVKRIFKPEIKALERALGEMVEAKIIGKDLIEISFGPDDYLFGEEKGMMEVLEGRRAIPRQSPPHEAGLFHNHSSVNPTLVNNVETLSNIPQIISKGSDWFKEVGTKESPGTMLFTLSGDIKKPGVYELPLGTPFRELVEKHGEGPLNGKKLRYAFSGVANAVLPETKFKTPLDFDAMKEAGSGLGSGGFIVYDETACPVKIAYTYSWFLSEESCGQCVSCKTGCESITVRLQELEGEKGTQADLEEIKNRLDTVENGRMCYLAAEENLLIRSICQGYWEEFLNHVGKRCSYDREVGLPKMMDLDETNNQFIYDTAYKGKSLLI